jgi:hypothetical protein
MADAAGQRVQGPIPAGPALAGGPTDEHGYVDRWPAGPGQPQYEWEPPRTTQRRLGRGLDESSRGLDESSLRTDRLRLLGNGCVPAQVEKAFRTLWAMMEKEVKNTNE